MRPFGDNREKGAAALEFAVILPLLLLVVFGIMEFGIILYNQAVMTNACREGARAGIVAKAPNVTAEEITAIVNDRLDNLIISGSGVPAITIVPADTAGAVFGDDLEVAAFLDHEFLLLPGFIPGLPQPLQMAAKTVMKYE